MSEPIAIDIKGTSYELDDVLRVHDAAIGDLQADVEQLQGSGDQVLGTDHTVDPERYVRTQITKNTKGYNAETTVSVTMTGSFEELERELTQLNRIADRVVRNEINHREVEDRLAAEQGGS